MTSPVKEREASIEHLDQPEEQVACDNCHSGSAEWRLNFVCGAAMLLCAKCWKKLYNRIKTGKRFFHRPCNWFGYAWQDHIRATPL